MEKCFIMDISQQDVGSSAEVIAVQQSAMSICKGVIIPAVFTRVNGPGKMKAFISPAKKAFVFIVTQKLLRGFFFTFPL